MRDVVPQIVDEVEIRIVCYDDGGGPGEGANEAGQTGAGAEFEDCASVDELGGVLFEVG